MTDPPPRTLQIRDASIDDVELVRALFVEYQDWLGVDLCFQGFEEELAQLPGCYAPPSGAVFLAIDARVAFGCVGIRPHGERDAELKRLYVRPAHRGCGAGRALFEAAMRRARAIGYAGVVLDTLPSMDTARSMYQAYGFREIPPYYANPVPGAEYYRLDF